MFNYCWLFLWLLQLIMKINETILIINIPFWNINSWTIFIGKPPLKNWLTWDCSSNNIIIIIIVIFHQISDHVLRKCQKEAPSPTLWFIEQPMKTPSTSSVTWLQHCLDRTMSQRFQEHKLERVCKNFSCHVWHKWIWL